MRTSVGNSGHYDSNRSLNRPWVLDQKAHLPMRSSAQVFAQQSASDSSLKRISPRTSKNFSSSQDFSYGQRPPYNQNPYADPHSSYKPQPLSGQNSSPQQELYFNQKCDSKQRLNYDQSYFSNQKQRSISPTGALPFNPDAGTKRYQTDRFFPEAAASSENNAPYSNTPYETALYTRQGGYAYTDTYGAPSAAIAVPRPARTPAGYMPYTQTAKMGKSEQTPSASETPSRSHKSQPPISFIDDDFPAGSGGSAMAPDVYPPDFDQDVAGAGVGVKPLDKKQKADNPQKDRFRKNLKYGEYLSIPQGKKSIFIDNGERHNRALLWMGIIILVVLIVAVIVVWSFV